MASRRLPQGLPGHVFTDLKRQAAELDPRPAQERADRLLRGLSQPQLDFVLDDSPQIAVCTARRTGKTFALLRRWVRKCQQRGIRPRRFVYAALSRASAKIIAWDSLIQLNADYQLAAEFNYTELTMRMPGGHLIQLGGADDQADIERYRGQGNDEFAIDESQSFPTALLKKFVEQVVGPTLLDRRGTLIMMGTPAAVLSGAFYEATRPDSKVSRPWRERQLWDGPYEWSFHTWSLEENTGVPGIWEAALAKKKRNGWTDENPVWQREYVGRWVADDTGFVYRFNVDRNVQAPGRKTPENPFGLPAGHEWTFVYGMDMGWKDPFAIQVGAYSPTHPQCFRVYEFSRTEMMIDEIGTLINALIEKTGYPDAMVADDSHMGGAIIAELNERFGFSIERAEKKSKNDHIEMMNADLVDGKFIILRGPGEPVGQLEREMLTLQWDETGTREDKGMDNHACDAAIYMRRKAFHHYHEEPPQAPMAKHSPAAQAARLAEKEAELDLKVKPGRDYYGDEIAVEFDRGGDEDW